MSSVHDMLGHGEEAEMAAAPEVTYVLWLADLESGRVRERYPHGPAVKGDPGEALCPWCAEPLPAQAA